jgi:pantoate--beta-alanine ligase
MEIVRTMKEMQARVRALRRTSETLGLVPTMGALHEGHLSLVWAAKAACERVCVTVFVNPLQFGAGEDFARYPRTFEQDCAMLEREGVDWVFAPSAEEMYSAGASTVVDVPDVGTRLDGASRPGHFRGVATVVAKLFHIVAADKAFFGQKDAAQVAVLRRMVRDLNFDLELVVCPTVREKDGLAMSSRNAYLSAEERLRAVGLSRALFVAREFVGERFSNPVVQLSSESVRAGEVRDVMLHELRHVRVDYAAVVDAGTLEDVEFVGAGTLLAVAGWVGETRLIDNVVVE